MSTLRDVRLCVCMADAGQRLDTMLARHLPLSRRRIRRAIDEGGVYVNRRRCRTAGRRLRLGDRLRVCILADEILHPFEPEQLIWQRDHLFLIHKRSGQYAQEALHRSRGTLPEELADYLRLPATQRKRLRPVHRLDRGTSGLLLFCHHPPLLQHLQAHWADCVEKQYLAVVEPAPAWQKLHIRLAISCRADALGRYRIEKTGRACDTLAEVVERRGERALVRLVPRTGRTHQLRVHLAASGCPILGDTRYGGATHPRLMLHAYRLCVQPAALPTMHAWQTEPEEDW